MSLSTCIIFATVTDLVTAVWVALGQGLSFHTLALAMFFPGVFSLVFVDNAATFIEQIFGMSRWSESLISSAIASAAVFILVGACAVLDLVTGWGNFDGQAGIHEHNKNPAMGFLRAAGEEIGWRCYLLPCLISRLNPTTALLISGCVWGLYHVPVLILLTQRLKPPHPYLTVAVQCVSCVLAAFPYGWVAIKAGYTMWPSTVMHFVWNLVNPYILGSIYTQTPGVLTGPQWLINGEGMAGCLVMLPVAVHVVLDLKGASRCPSGYKKELN